MATGLRFACLACLACLPDLADFALFGLVGFLAAPVFAFALPLGVLGTVLCLGRRAGKLVGRRELPPPRLRVDCRAGASFLAVDACLEFGDDGACIPSDNAGPAGTHTWELLACHSAFSRTVLYFGSSLA